MTERKKGQRAGKHWRKKATVMSSGRDRERKNTREERKKKGTASWTGGYS